MGIICGQLLVGVLTPEETALHIGAQVRVDLLVGGAQPIERAGDLRRVLSDVEIAESVSRRGELRDVGAAKAEPRRPQRAQLEAAVARRAARPRRARAAKPRHHVR